MNHDTWLKYYGEHDEHVFVYVDGLLIESKDSQGEVDALIHKHHFKLKGTALSLIILDAILEEIKMVVCTLHLENMSRRWKNVTLTRLCQKPN